MVDHVRDRFWLRDTSPAREAERQTSVARTIAREHARTGQPLQGLRQYGVGARRVAEALAQLQALLARSRGQEESQAGSALNVRLYPEKQREQGMGF
jgi:hypothetical protein